MSNSGEYIKNLYRTDGYIIKNPSLHEEDTPWKVSKITPLIDVWVNSISKKQITILDIGGGAGLVLKAVYAYIKENYRIKVNKAALDLSPGALKIQMKCNPDLSKAINEDICETSLPDKEIDLALMIDVLEHVSNPSRALAELKRISRFAILKVPLEDNLLLRFSNFLSHGRTRRTLFKNLGHVNYYTLNKLKFEIEKNMGQLLNYYFTNAFEGRRSQYHVKNVNVNGKLVDFAGTYLFKVSPKLCARVLPDFVMILVKCY
jgi:ubiquinone/menaquinone biosynthesis C-methylase UbiE